MRTVLKQQLLDMVNTLHQAHKEIEIYRSKEQYTSAKSLLSQCQECAISIGTTIEEFEETDCITVSYIENYCEFLYHIYKESEQNNTWNSRETYESLEGYLSTIENSIRNDIPSKKEIVFLPYKVSMWDSLESVWKAADEDPECDAYVIPIPYYDKNPDGTLRCEHYEGDAFPEDVPITHYNNYDFKTRKPDAIFIHNPYDENNYVTTVHPFFYTAKLKEYCRKLIYIPYYVSAEVNPDSVEVMEDRAGYILSNGVLYSDMVFVQSENTKKLFVNVLEKNLSGIHRSYWENKIFGIGSPKFDRVHTTQRDDTRLPENWKEIIYTNTGKRKKTILYNISVSTLLNHPEVLKKIKDTLDFFQKNTEIALWWRPHPLYESTLKSMRPGLLAEYKKIVRKYKQEAWGIFDNGFDLNWAIAETDAYYGDRSSVINLYKKVQKPVMIQDTFVKSKRRISAEDIPIWPSALCIDEEDLWFVHGKMNVLMRYNLQEKHTHIVDKIPNESIFQTSGYVGIYKRKNKIFLIPSQAREIAIFDVSKITFKKKPIRYIEKYDGKRLFTQVYSKKHYLYCIPSWYEAIIRIDMDSDDLEYIKLPFRNLIKQTYINQSIKFGNKLYAIYSYTNRALCFDMNSNQVSLETLGNSSHQFISIGSIGNSLYLFDSAKKTIFKIDEQDHTRELEFYNPMYESAALFNIPDNLLLVDSTSTAEIMLLDNLGNCVYKKEERQIMDRNNLFPSHFRGFCTDISKTKAPFFYISSGTTLVYKFVQNTLEECFFITLQEKEFEKLKTIISHEYTLEVDETELYDLKAWSKYLPEKVSSKHSSICGYKIFEIVKNCPEV